MQKLHKGLCSNHASGVPRASQWRYRSGYVPQAMGTQPYHDADLEAARIRFGQMIKRWMHSGGWSTKTPMAWAQAAGLPQLSNNTVSFIWAGSQPKTSPRFFTTIGYLNRRLADQDYGPITERALLDRVRQLKPLCHSNGTPWGAVDFFACYIGDIDPPPEYDTGPPGKARLLTPELAQRISSHQRERFERHATSRGLDKAAAWAELKANCTGMTPEQLDAFQQVLSGWRAWSPEELAQLCDGDRHNAALLALQRWCGADLLQELADAAYPT